MISRLSFSTWQIFKLYFTLLQTPSYLTRMQQHTLCSVPQCVMQKAKTNMMCWPSCSAFASVVHPWEGRTEAELFLAIKGKVFTWETQFCRFAVLNYFSHLNRYTRFPERAFLWWKENTKYSRKLKNFCQIFHDFSPPHAAFFHCLVLIGIKVCLFFNLTGNKWEIQIELKTFSSHN